MVSVKKIRRWRNRSKALSPRIRRGYDYIYTDEDGFVSVVHFVLESDQATECCHCGPICSGECMDCECDECLDW